MPRRVSERLRKVTVWCPWGSDDGVEIEVPFTFRMMVETPSTSSSALLEPDMTDRPILAEVPVKENVTPVPGHVNSRVLGFTRPRKRTAVACSRLAISMTRGVVESFMMGGGAR